MLQLMNALEDVSDVALIVNDRQEFVFANHQARRLLQIDPNPGAGIPCYPFMCAQDPDNRQVCAPDCAVLKMSMNGGSSRSKDVVLLTKGGLRRRFSMSVFNYKVPENGACYLVHFFRNHERKPLVSVNQPMGNDLESVLDADRVTSGSVSEPLRRFAELTPREREVLAHLVRGEGTRVISEGLSITINTTRNHIQHTLQKLGVHSRAEAVSYVLRHELFTRWRQTRWW